jgi:hypothetical protein
MTNYRLKQTITAEPLFNRWYAWPLLIYPPTAALITRNLHLRLLESYRNMPQLHNAAATSRSLAGGKFVQANVSIDEVAALHESTVLDPHASARQDGDRPVSGAVVCASAGTATGLCRARLRP